MHTKGNSKEALTILTTKIQMRNSLKHKILYEDINITERLKLIDIYGTAKVTNEFLIQMCGEK